jgi:hypothetical protein
LSERALPYISNPGNGLWPSVVNRILDLDGPKRMTAPIPTSDTRFYKLWRAFLEISNSFNSIKDVPSYLRHSPPKHLGVPNSRYIAWQVHNYLNEIYILQQRLGSFWGSIQKSYRTSAPAQSKLTNKKVDSILKAFDSVVKIRGSHVHEQRLEDPEIERLAVIENMASFPWPPEVLPYFRKARGEVKKSWVSRMSANEPQIKSVLDAFFEVVHPIVFTSAGEWIQP